MSHKERAVPDQDDRDAEDHNDLQGTVRELVEDVQGVLKEDDARRSSLTRRHFLQLSGAAAAGAAIRPDVPPYIKELQTNLYFAQRIEPHVLSYVENTLKIMEGGTETDWAYRADRTFDAIDQVTSAVETMISTAVTGGSPEQEIDRMERFQRLCPDEFLVSSPYDDARATFTEHGRLSTYHDGVSHYVIYQVEDGDHAYDGALPGEGGQAGVLFKDSEEVDWLWDAFELQDAWREDHVVTFAYEHPDRDIAVTQEAYMPFDAEAEDGSGAIQLDYEITADEELDLDVVYALRANVNQHIHDAVFFLTNRNRGAVEGDMLHWEDLETDNDLYLALNDAENSGFIRAPISDADRDSVYDRVDEYVEDRDVIGRVPTLPDRLRDHMEQAIVEESFDDLPDGTPFEDMLDEAEDTVNGRYLTGYQRKSLSIGPGDAETVSVTIGDTPESLDTVHKPGNGAEATRSAWKEWRSQLDLTDVHPHFREEVVDWTATLVKNWVPSKGTGLAASSWSPPYSRVWHRDVTAMSEALMEVGLEGLAEDYLTEFVPGVLEDDGALHQAHTADRRGAYLVERTYDQVAGWFIALDRLDDHVTYDPFDRVGGDTVERAADFLVASTDRNGLPEPGWDYQESPHELRSSVYSADQMQKALECVQDHGYASSRHEKTGQALQDAKQRYFLGDQLVKSINVNSRDTDYDGMASVIYSTGHETDPTYMEQMMEAVGVDTVTESWTVALNQVARAAAILGDEQLTVNGETYTGNALAYDRLQNTIDTATEHGIMREKFDEDGNPTDASHLSWSQAKPILAAIALDNTYRPSEQYL